MQQKTIAVIGGGSAGLTGARTACQLGAKVLFFMGNNAEHASLCIEAGCMPSKALFEPIDAMHHAKQHGWLKVEPNQPDQYLAQIVRWKNAEIAQFHAYRQEEIDALAGDNFRVIPADASFVNEHEVVSGSQRFHFDAAIIASGSVTKRPAISGLDPSWVCILTSDEIL